MLKNIQTTPPRSIPSEPAVTSPLTRRQLLRTTGGAALGAAALGSTAFAPVTTAVTRPPQTAALGDAVTGPLANTYGRYGVPRGVILGQVGDPTTSRAVTWQTTGSVNPGTVVRFAKVAPGTDLRDLTLNDLTQTATGSSQFAPSGLYEDDDNTTIGIEGEHPSLVHRVVLPLEPGEQYAYTVGDSDQLSPIEMFRPTPGHRDSWTFTHLGDHGTGPASRRTTRWLADHVRPDLHLIAGDISYADGYQPGWDQWQNEASPLHRSVPLLTAPGNHESKDYYGESYRQRIARPNQSKNWFSFTQGRVFFFSTSAGAFLGDQQTMRGATDLAQELVMMEIELAQAAARRAAGEIDFIVVTQHFPIYTNHDTRGPVSPAYVIAQEHLLQRWGVDLLLVGHDHMYQRSLPMAYGVPTGFAPEDGGPGYTQIVAGSGGKSLYDFTDLKTFDIVPPDVSDPASIPAYLESQTHRQGAWTGADLLQYCFVEYAVRPGEMTVTGWVFPDFTDADGNLDWSGADSYSDIDAAFDNDREPIIGDQITLRPKGALVLAEVARQRVRTPVEILADVPEAHGRPEWRIKDDCTQHAH
jgi:predicted MPP superfamily phosphohydrolase